MTGSIWEKSWPLLVVQGWPGVKQCSTVETGSFHFRARRSTLPDQRKFRRGKL